MTTILLVDDARDIKEVVTTLLTDEGFDVSDCDMAEEALRRMTVTLPDLLILDGRLPGMSGWECLDLVRSANGWPRLPVVMLTAAVNELQAFARTTDACTAYLAKPFDFDDLLVAISSILETCQHQPA